MRTTTRTIVALTVAPLLALGLSGCRVAYDEPVVTAADQSAPSSAPDAPTTDDQTQLELQFDDLTVEGYTSITFEQLRELGDSLDILVADESAVLAVVGTGLIVEDSDGINTQKTDLGVELTIQDARGGWLLLVDSGAHYVEINIAGGF